MILYLVCYRQGVISALFFCGVLFASDYGDPLSRISITYDETNWSVKPIAVGDADRSLLKGTLLTLERKNSDEQYHARFSIVSDSLSFKGALDEQLVKYHKHATDFLKSQRFHILDTFPRKIQNVQGIETLAVQRDFGLQFRQVVFIHNSKAYLATASSRIGKMKEYEREFDGILNSVRFEKK